MRIISGTVRGKQLTTPRGGDIRPTPDRVREAIFSILLSRFGSFAGIRVLDLFAGTGAMALEALSRGAESAVLIDRGGESGRIIPINIRVCGMESRSAFRQAEVLETLPRLVGSAPFGLVFLDPPYRQGLVVPVLQAVAELGLVRPDGLVCAETARDEHVPECAETFVLIDRRDYGSTSVHFFSQASA